MTGDVDGKLYSEKYINKEITAYVDALSYENGKFKLEIIADCPNNKIIKNFAKLLQDNSLLNFTEKA